MGSLIFTSGYIDWGGGLPLEGPQISNVHVSAYTETTATISWNLNVPATGQVEYGPTVAYGSFSTLENSFIYTTHIQTISGLSDSTTYHYRVLSRAANGILTTSPDYTFDTAVPPPDPADPPPPEFTYPPDTALSYVLPNNDPRPAYLGTIVDSTWGTTIRRISNTNMWRNSYATVQPWSKNDKWIYFGYGNRLINGQTYADVRQVTGLEVWLWSHIDEDIAYGIGNPATTVKKYNAATNTMTTLRSFAATYNFLSPGGYDTNLSIDDRMCILARKPSGTWDIVVYDCKNDVIIATKPTGSTALDQGHGKMHVSGNAVNVGYGVNGTGAEQGIWSYNISGSSLVAVRQMANGTQHNDTMLDIDGNDAFMTTESPIRITRLVDGRVTNMGFGTASGPPNVIAQTYGHVSGQAYLRPGWCVMSSPIHYGGTTQKGFDQVVSLKTDGSGTTEVFGFAHAVKDEAHYNYNGAPFAVPNRTGDKVMFGSNWQGVPDSNIYAYVASKPGPPPQYPPTTTLSFVTPPSSTPVPSYLTPTDDTTWGTKVMRISNEDTVANYYSKIQCWNSDQTRIFLARRGGYPGVLLDAATYAVLNNAQAHSGNPQYSNVTPNKSYGAVNGTNKLFAVTMTTGVQTTVHTFSGYYDVSLGNGEGGISLDDRYFALIAQVTNGGTTHVLVYDQQTDAVITTITQNGVMPNNCMMTPSGQYVIIGYNTTGSGINQGTQLYSRAGVWQRQLTTLVNHGDVGVTTAGDEAWVCIEGRGRMYRLSDGAMTNLTPVTSAPGHVSCRNYDWPGWAIFSPYQTSAGVGHDQIFAQRLDTSGDVKVYGFAHNHSTDGNPYSAEPQATVSRDGKKVLWASNRGLTAVYAYVAGLNL